MLLICMSMAGTASLIFCILLLLIKRKNFSYRLGRKLVLLSLAGYLIPFQLVKYYLPQDFLEDTNSLNTISYFVNFDNKEALSYHGISIWMSDWVLMIGLSWLFLITGFSIYEIIKYHQLTKKLKRDSSKRSRFVNEIGEIHYRISDQIDSPYTIGFIKPFIVFPENMEDDPLSELLLKHECCHQRRHDSIVKLLCLLAICLHFFNPLALLTLLLYTKFSEYIADEAATGGCSKEECKAYAIALVTLSGKTRQVPVVWRNNLLGDEKSMKRRVELIMRKNKKASKIGTVAAVMASVILSGTTVLAYAPMQATTNHYDNMTTEGTFGFNSVATEQTFNGYDTYFENENHDITILNAEATVSTRAILCSHNFESGYLNQHITNSSGGCTVKVYRAKHCTKCNHYEIYELVNTITYTKCIH